MGITIKDLAELANVSKGTVSRVINRAPGVSEETRKRILKLIKELDYQPNISAQGLAAKRSYNIGIIIPHTGNYSMSSSYWPTLLTAVNEQAIMRGYNLLLSTARSENDVESAYKMILKGRRVDGLIIGADQFGERQLAELVVKDFPFVLVGKAPHHSYYYVDVDNRGGAEQMTEYLIKQGHRNIVFLAGPQKYPYVQDRVKGYKQAMTEAGLSRVQVFYCVYDIREAKEKSKEILRAEPETTAIFGASPELVWGVIKAAQEERINIPNDLTLVSFDDHPLYEVFSPEITVVNQPIHELGKLAVEQLFTIMKGKIPKENRIILPTEIIVRGSCRATGQ